MASNQLSSGARARAGAVLRDLLAPPARFARLAAQSLGLFDPWLRLAIRLWLAQSFLGVQIVMAMTGESLGSRMGGTLGTGLLARVADGGLGQFAQVAFPLLLGLGLLTRPAALALLVQAILLSPADESRHAIWALLLAILLVRGPGSLSIDALVGPGLGNAPVPGVRALQRIYRGLTAAATPILCFVLRLVVAAVVLWPHRNAMAPLSIGSGAMHAMGAMRAMLPATPSGFAWLSDVPALVLAGALLLGLGVRPVALALFLLAPAGSGDFWAEGFYWMLLLGHLLIEGGGLFAIDEALNAAFSRMAPHPAEDAHHVVVVGGGFGGIAVARGLAGAPCRVTIIDQRNYNLFQPLLYQVATAGLSSRDIATPIRSLLRRQSNARVILGTVDGVDAAERRVVLGDRTLPYDTLVLATGARHSYFGRDEWRDVAPGLKTVEDAIEMRGRLLLAFERAEATDDLADRRAWMTFVVVGGGPTGVELAGAIAELARFSLEREFRAIDPASARVILVQSAPRLLPTFDERSSREALDALGRLGVEVLLGARADTIDASGIVSATGRIAARTVLWAAGVEASPAARWLDALADRAGRVVVGPDLRVPGFGETFALGDTCASLAWEGRPVPGLAPAAKQAGAYVASVVAARLRDRRAPKPFRYRHVGNLATIGRKAAVAEFGPLRLRGAVAWWLWGAAHVFFLIDGRSRVGVIVEWLWDYLTARKGTRLIVGSALRSKLVSP